jgi:ABC-type antimicrobial peptide transport system ATPase subunit
MRDLVPGTSSDDVARLLRELGLADDPEFRLLGQRKLGELGRGLSESLDARLRLVRAVLSKPDIIVTDDRVFLYDAAARAALERSAEVNGIAVIVMLQPIVAVPSTWLPKNSAHDASNLEVNTVN